VYFAPLAWRSSPSPVSSFHEIRNPAPAAVDAKLAFLRALPYSMAAS
jgi:hypothetical protein